MDINVNVKIEPTEGFIKLVEMVLRLTKELPPKEPTPPPVNTLQGHLIEKEPVEQISVPPIEPAAPPVVKAEKKPRRYRTPGEMQSAFEIAVSHIEKFIKRRVSFTVQDVLQKEDWFGGGVRSKFDAWMISNSHRVVKEKIIGAHGFGSKVIYSPYWKENGVTFYAEHPKPQKTHVVKGATQKKPYNTKEQIEKTLSEEFDLDMHQNIPVQRKLQAVR